MGSGIESRGGRRAAGDAECWVGRMVRERRRAGAEVQKEEFGGGSWVITRMRRAVRVVR